MTDRVEAFAWNPRTAPPVPLLRRLRVGPRKNNFGDLVGPVVVDLMRSRLGLSDLSSAGRPTRLFSVGSVLHFAADGDVVWGSGVNGKIAVDRYGWRTLDVRAVRGPLTRAWIADRAQQDVPAVYGDPALLLFELGFPVPVREPSRSVTYIPNLNDLGTAAPATVVSPRSPLPHVLEQIAASEVVITSSLHALVFAELLGVPVALIKPTAESAFKYEDYARGTGRDDLPMFDSFAAAVTHLTTSVHRDENALASWSSEPLRAAFPSDIFRPKGARS
ncbi:polysaccharide pyruvyl transferase family protein [Microbacterium enclense]|uniref:polysaccharide pyruvyl transferase family protein n=1 Tax=Microbacterium enclense TaxID=993073 RepID=UPI0021A821B9|nr:polysaccharide pyruvyl transferase family protein [Microbacterium enclense]MCT2085764.1 polysaccharide pyruvyl transferase family protein [Microbacterium enclense]